MRNKLYLSKVANTSRIISVQINVTNNCPCKCVMCNKHLWPRTSLSREQFISRLGQFSTVDSIVLSGGEPLQYRYLEEIVRYPLIDFGMFTTGVGNISDELLKKFFWVRVSIDGFENTHNHIRNANVYTKAIEFVKRCHKEGSRVRIQYTIGQNNYLEFIDFCKFVVSSLGVECFGFYAHGEQSLSLSNKKDLEFKLYQEIVEPSFDLSKTNIPEIVSSNLLKPYRSVKCAIPLFHRVIDSDNTEWPCCYVMADNLLFENRDMKYECSSSIHSDVTNKKTPFCEVCDSFCSRYQRINEEYDFMHKSEPVFL